MAKKLTIQIFHKTRYFYKDRVEAVWMEKNFSMKIIAAPGAFYIHPDSAFLLEPMVDDLVLNEKSGRVYLVTYAADLLRKSKGASYGPMGRRFVMRSTMSAHTTIFDPAYENANITDEFIVIRRDGKPFHWPIKKVVEEFI